MIYLFRKKSRPHVFITPDDPNYRYTYLCGHCDYPVEPEDPICPRCKRELVDCPVCRDRMHRRAHRTEPDSQTKGIHCPVCQIRRYSAGRAQLETIHGFFCTNLYGCPAGGLQLRNGELAVLRPNSTVCPVCFNGESQFSGSKTEPDVIDSELAGEMRFLKPRNVQSYRELLNLCHFCNTAFGPSVGWPSEPQPIVKLRLGSEEGPCSLCGRHDLMKEEETAAERRIEFPSLAESEPESLSIPKYLRLVELARALSVEHSEEAVFEHLFGLWYDRSGKRPSEEHRISVREIADHLYRGTIVPKIRGILQERIDGFKRVWNRHIAHGVAYPVSAELTQVEVELPD